jgi:drug/metabolite transporter (DMT)-like permease
LVTPDEDGTIVVFTLGIGAACFVGLGLVLQQRVAQRLGLSEFLSARLLLRLLREREWLLGLFLMIVGQVLGGFALNQGDVSLVEPLLATNLFFALVFARALGGHSLGWRGWLGMLSLGGGVTLFIVAGDPSSGVMPDSQIRHWVVLGAVIAAAALLVAVARRLNLFEEATLLGAAAGLLFGLQDALTHVTAHVWLAHGFAGMLLHWQPYGLVAAAAVGQVLMQSAFEAAPLRSSLPAITVAEPLAGIVCGVGILGDRLHVTGLALAGEVCGIALCVVGVFILGRHPALPDGHAAVLPHVLPMPAPDEAVVPAQSSRRELVSGGRAR